jgi:hypothetical protein
MASLSNINGLFDVHSTGAILFSTSHGTSGQILQSSGNAAPIWVNASTIIGGPYLPLSGGILTGATSTSTGISFTVGGNLIVNGASATVNALSATTGSFTGNVTAPTFNGLAINTTGLNNVANQIARTDSYGYANFGWIQSTSGNHTGSITRITASNDQYLRYVTPAQFRVGVTDGYYAPTGTVSGVTSVATGNGLTGGTITSTGTLSMSGSYSGTLTATTFSGPLTGNATTSTTFNTGRTNYYNVTNNAVIGQMMWKNYGNNHTIFDASQSTSPSGSSVNNTNSNTAWTAAYPTLMGWNGSSTYGVRVDSARVADSTTGSAASAGTLTHNANRVDSTSYPVVWMSGSPSPAYSCAAVTITSSVGRINATTFNGALTGNATTASSAPNALNQNQYYNVVPGNGYGIRFWSSDSYKISMGAAADYYYGPVTDYSIKTQMDAGSTGRGFTWGRVGVVPIAGLNSTSGNFQTAGTFTAGGIITAAGGNSTQWNSAYANQGNYLPLAGGIMSGNIGRSAHNVGFQVGGYNNIGGSDNYSNPIFAIGTSYMPSTTTLSDMYGIGYTNASASFISFTGASSWGMYVAANGVARVWLGGNNGAVSTNGAMYSPIYYDTNTAFLW